MSNSTSTVTGTEVNQGQSVSSTETLTASSTASGNSNSITGVYSRNLNTYMLTKLSRPPTTYTIPVTNNVPLRDGTGSTGQTITYFEYPTSLQGLAFQRATLINNPAANAHFATMKLAVTKRLSNRWSFDASYSVTQIHIPIVPNTGTPTSLYIYVATDDPNDLINNSNNPKEAGPGIGRLHGAVGPWAVVHV